MAHRAGSCRYIAKRARTIVAATRKVSVASAGTYAVQREAGFAEAEAKRAILACQNGLPRAAVSYLSSARRAFLAARKMRRA